MLINYEAKSQSSVDNSSGKKDSIVLRRKELIVHGGLKAACTYRNFLSFDQYKANLHCHSYHSDGSQYCDETAEWYINNGYQVLSITDHDAYGDQDGGVMKSDMFQSDTIVHDWDGDGMIHKIREYRSGNEAYVRDYSKPAPGWVPRTWQMEQPGKFVILNGIEYSFGHPHINAINHPSGIIARPRESYGFIEYTHANKGLVFINHMSEWNLHPERIFKNPDLRKLDGLEVMNGFLARDNRDGKNSDGSPGFAEGLWDGCLNAGLQLWGFANDDMHNLGGAGEDFAGPGSAWNMIWAKDLTRESVMEALRAGAFYGSCGIKVEKIKVTPGSISVRSGNATHIMVIGDGGRTLLKVNKSRARYVLKGDEKWIRIILWNDTICYPDEGPKFPQKAWLQPIMLERLLTSGR
jgi:hypothetical protein